MLQKNMKILILLLLLIVFVTGCSSQHAGESSKGLKIGLLMIDDSLPFFIAEEKNIFAKNNVQVELIPFSSAREKDLALEAGELDGVLTDLVVTALMRKGGTDARVAALSLGATPKEGRFVILASPDSNITTAEDLKGVPIAISNNTLIHYLSETMPLEAGLSKNDIKTISIPDLRLRLDTLLANNDVHAALLPDPLAALAERQGAKAIIDDTMLAANLSQSIIIFRGDTIDNQREQVTAVLKSFKEAAELFMDNPEDFEDLRMEKTRVPEPLRGTYPPPVFSPLQVPTPEMVERVMEWMVEKKLLTEPYSYEEIVDKSLIK